MIYHVLYCIVHAIANNVLYNKKCNILYICYAFSYCLLPVYSLPYTILHTVLWNMLYYYILYNLLHMPLYTKLYKLLHTILHNI